MTGDLPYIMYLMQSTNMLQSNINLSFSYSDTMLRIFDETPSRVISCSLGMQTMMRVGQGQLGSTDLSGENCLQQMHFIAQLCLLLELVLHICKLVRRTSFFLFSSIPMLSLSLYGFSGGPHPGFLSAPLPPDMVGPLFQRFSSFPIRRTSCGRSS